MNSLKAYFDLFMAPTNIVRHLRGGVLGPDKLIS